MSAQPWFTEESPHLFSSKHTQDASRITAGLQDFVVPHDLLQSLLSTVPPMQYSNKNSLT